MINGHMQAQIACYHLGEFREAQEHALAVRLLGERVAHAERCLTFLDPLVGSLAESSRNRWITGYLASCLADADAAVATALEIQHPDSLAFAWLFHGWVRGYRLDWAGCLASVEKGIAIAEQSGSVQSLAWNRCVRGWARAHVGEIQAGISELSSALGASSRIMGYVALPQFSAMMAEALMLRDDVATAEGWLQRAIASRDSHADRYFAAEIHRLSARCLTTRGQKAAALAHVQKAIDVARSQGADMFELRAAIMLTHLEPKPGRSALRAVLARFPEPEARPDIDEARRVAAV